MTKSSFMNIIPIGRFEFPQSTADEAGVGNMTRSPAQICFYGVRTDAFLAAMATVSDQVQMVCCNIKTSHDPTNVSRTGLWMSLSLVTM